MVQSLHMESSSEEQKTPRKTPRTRTRARRVRSSDSTRPRRDMKAPKRVKKVAPRKVSAPKPEVAVPDKQEGRKAPTPFASSKEISTKKRKRVLIVAVLMIMGVGASAAVGITDSGQINVQKTIEERNERIRNNTASSQDKLTGNVEIPVQNTSQKPGGGLKGRGVGTKTPVVVTPLESEVASSSATSSDGVASSTEDVVEEDGDESDSSDNTEETVLSEEDSGETSI